MTGLDYKIRIKFKRPRLNPPLVEVIFRISRGNLIKTLMFRLLFYSIDGFSVVVMLNDNFKCVGSQHEEKSFDYCAQHGLIPNSNGGEGSFQVFTEDVLDAYADAAAKDDFLLFQNSEVA